MNSCLIQLLSVISLLSSDRPDTSSPANVDAAVEARDHPEGVHNPVLTLLYTLILSAYSIQEEGPTPGPMQR